MKFLITVLVLCAAMIGVMAQTPIPNRPDGYTNGPAGAPVVIDAFVDMLCPDSAATWPMLLELPEHYGDNLQLNFHTFPLPYHTWSFIANQGVHVIYSLTNLTNTYAYAKQMFLDQSTWYNANTMGLSTDDVVKSLAQWVESNNFASADDFTKGINDDNLNWDTRVSWKYGCSRGITGTPNILVNGVLISSFDPSWNLTDWESVIDPLLAPTLLTKCNTDKEIRRFATLSVGDNPPTCKVNQTICNYSPNKYQCCLAGEMCIPNVGCRC
jgi:hypothetical protein